MTKINDYLWYLPHAPLDDDPEDVGLLQQNFNAPVAAMLEAPLSAMGYKLTSNDIMVKLDERLDGTADTYYANVRFIAYLQPDIIMRVHIEHAEWAHFLYDNETHRFYINLDRFKVQSPDTQVVVPAWSGRLHTRMSNDPQTRLHHDGNDQVWTFTSGEELEAAMQLFQQKFNDFGHPWLSDLATLA